MRESSRFCLGSNKVLRVALGVDAATEQRSNLSKLSDDIEGPTGLLFTKLSKEEITKLVESFEVLDFARAGAVAIETFGLKAGPVLQYDAPIAHTIEPTLRQHGMPTKLVKGIVELVADYEICREGEVLKPNQAALLRIFDVKMAVFKLELLGVWESDNYTQLAGYGA